ncbi:hypothetical protein FRC07_012876, partial [Ceratobasidium sp. 392]
MDDQPVVGKLSGGPCPYDVRGEGLENGCKDNEVLGRDAKVGCGRETEPGGGGC